MTPVELQAIILAAGKGSRISELSSKCPKCLLPVANKPLIFYPLQTLQDAKFKDVIIIVADNQEEVINRALAELRLDIHYELVAVPFNKDFGTADSLRFIKDKIKNDMLVLSCDVVSDYPLTKLIDLYRLYNPTLVALISSINSSPEPLPGRKGRDRPERDLIGIDRISGDRLVFLSSEADFLEDDSVTFRVSMIKKCPQFEMYSNLLDAHTYILKKWTIKYLDENPNISSLKSEFLPSLVRKQFRKEKPKQLKNNPHPSSIVSTTHRLQIFDYIDVDELDIQMEKLQPDASELGDEQLKQKIANEYPRSKIKCFAHQVKDGYCVRANTLAGYWEANRLLLNQPAASDRKSIGTPSSDGPNRSIIGNLKLLGQKTSIKRSIIGNGSLIGDKVKLTKSIVMDNVVIEEGCNIQGSIVCNNVHISNNAEIKDCIIAASQTIVTHAKFSNEEVMDIDQMMEL